MAFLNEQGLARLWLHITTKLSNKIDKEEGKSLSTNDYTNDDKNALSGAVENINEINITLEEFSKGITDATIDEICV